MTEGMISIEDHNAALKEQKQLMQITLVEQRQQFFEEQTEEWKDVVEDKIEEKFEEVKAMFEKMQSGHPESMLTCKKEIENDYTNKIKIESVKLAALDDRVKKAASEESLQSLKSRGTWTLSIVTAFVLIINLIISLNIHA